MSLVDRLRGRLEGLRDVLPGGFGRTSLAQEGEDLILARIFEHQDRGTYVDVGAHHPLRFSNTHLLYRRGWRGVNIDAAPGSMRLFRKLRPRDVNLEVGIAATAEERPFYVFDEPALSTFDAERAKQLDHPPYRITSIRQVRCAPLSTILREHSVTVIDLLTIDAEGFDFEVLQTLDWTATRPHVVLTEQFSRDLAALLESPVHGFLHERAYTLIAKTFNSVFYVRDEGA
jgi:FkbM family methyltransferase